MEVNHWNGTTEPRLILRCAQPYLGAGIERVGEPETFSSGVLAELERTLDPWPVHPPGPECRELRDVRGCGIAGVIADLVHTGEPVLVVAAHAAQRAGALGDRLGGFALTTWAALEDDPAIAAGYVHLVALDPPPHAHLQGLLRCAPGAGWAHLAWGTPELDFSVRILRWHYELRAPLADTYRALRGMSSVGGEACTQLLTGAGPQPRTPALAGRLVRILCELGLARRRGCACCPWPGAPLSSNPLRTDAMRRGWMTDSNG